MITETLFFKVPAPSANASHQHCAPNFRARISSRTDKYRKQFQIQLKSCIFIVTTFLLLSLLYADVKELQAVCHLYGAHPSGKIMIGSNASTSDAGTCGFDIKMVGLTGLEPVTLRLSSACSNQLSYRPGIRSVVPLPSFTRFKPQGCRYRRKIGGGMGIRTPDL